MKTFQDFDVDDPKVEERRSLLPKTIRRVENVKVIRVPSKWPGLTIATILFVWWTWVVISDLVWSEEPISDIRGNKYYEFDEIIPSEKLKWYPCFDVPGSSTYCVNSNTWNHTGDKFSESPLLLNPGGPGGSGTLFGLAAGSLIQNIVGGDQDVIGFDPRGIGATTPRADCFSYGGTYDGVGDDQARGDYHRLLFNTAGQAIGLANTSSTALRHLNARAKAMANYAWDDWTSSIKEESAYSDIADTDLPNEREPENEFEDAYLETKGKLVYWGFSYGTLLGSTFAAMFPDRVGRLVLDGVVDADHYVAPIWLESQRDADKVWSSFFKYCHEAKSACQFYRENDKVKDIEERFESFMERLKENPIPVVSKDILAPFLVTYSDVKYQIFLTLYAPLYGFRAAAELLDALERNLEGWFELVPTPPSYDLELVCNHSLPKWSYYDDAQRVILCSDKKYPLNHTYSEIESMFEDMEAQSVFADAWMSLMIQCSGYDIQNPVTPLFAGVKMATKFVDAGFFEQESEGHCTIAVKSRCTIEKVRAYFREGKVPDAPRFRGEGSDLLDEEWEKCPADEWPWHEYQPSALVANEVEAAELERLDAWGGIRDAFTKLIFGVRGSSEDLALPCDLAYIDILA
ncbi:putative alpha beta-hydrolase protein [Botrytis fragariae]|uniref:Putative alpha beta-hydrolase protein n=1 Tax=Botrytis fragariae TaxID=1964551 RepID=A0A8H6EKH4_9HELO|nr:putative alpha beta-hydrolase protein [Botrytis fragariae]KAF5875581.1 putative alpha beta-hydrolase protein [Botrytis fragariae]